MNRLFSIRSWAGRFAQLLPQKTMLLLAVLLLCTVGGMVVSVQLGSKLIPLSDVGAERLGGDCARRGPQSARFARCDRGDRGSCFCRCRVHHLYGRSGQCAVASAGGFLRGGARFAVDLLFGLEKRGDVHEADFGRNRGSCRHQRVMIVLSPITAASKAYIWMTGSIYGASWENVYAMLPWAIVFIPWALLYARILDVQELGDELATGLGARVQLHRCILLFISVALAGAAVAVAGAVGFIGLIGPHIARKLVGPSHGRAIPVAALIGSLLLLTADTVARLAFQPLDVPAGVFTAGVGAPFFIYLLYRSRNR